MMKKFILIITALVMIVSVAVQSHAQSFRDQTLFGRVLDEKGETLPGAMVASADGKRGAMTDEKGEFTMKILPTDKFVTVSFLGYLVQNVEVAGKENVTVMLVPDPENSLNEAVVIGYGEV